MCDFSRREFLIKGSAFLSVPNENSMQPMADVIPQANRGAQALLGPA